MNFDFLEIYPQFILQRYISTWFRC